MEKLIKMTAKLYQCRDSARSLAEMQGVPLLDKLKPYMDIIVAVMKARNLDSEINAILKISETESYKESGLVQMMFMAAAVELMEPSQPQP